jgi:hypothetical protein
MKLSKLQGMTLACIEGVRDKESGCLSWFVSGHGLSRAAGRASKALAAVSSLADFQRLKPHSSSLLLSFLHALNTFITSSPRWLITFTAIRPDSGF